MSDCCNGRRAYTQIRGPNPDVGFAGVDFQSSLVAARILDAGHNNGLVAVAKPGTPVTIRVDVANASDKPAVNRVVFIGVDGQPFYEVQVATAPRQHGSGTLTFDMLPQDVVMSIQLWEDAMFIGATEPFVVHAG